MPHRDNKNYGTLRPNMGNYTIQAHINMFLEEYDINVNNIKFNRCRPNDRDNTSYWKYWDYKGMNTDTMSLKKKINDVQLKKDRILKNYLITN